VRLHRGASLGFAGIGGTLTGSPFVVAILDTLANVGDWDGSTIELVNGDDLVDDGSGDITLVLVTVDTTVSTLGSGERARGSESKGCRELHRERIDIGSI
jgi:hypothetical protein